MSGETNTIYRKPKTQNRPAYWMPPETKPSKVKCFLSQKPIGIIDSRGMETFINGEEFPFLRPKMEDLLVQYGLPVPLEIRVFREQDEKPRFFDVEGYLGKVLINVPKKVWSDAEKIITSVINFADRLGIYLPRLSLNGFRNYLRKIIKKAIDNFSVESKAIINSVLNIAQRFEINFNYFARKAQEKGLIQPLQSR